MPFAESNHYSSFQWRAATLATRLHRKVVAADVVLKEGAVDGYTEIIDAEQLLWEPLPC